LFIILISVHRKWTKTNDNKLIQTQNCRTTIYYGEGRGEIAIQGYGYWPEYDPNDNCRLQEWKNNTITEQKEDQVDIQRKSR